MANKTIEKYNAITGKTVADAIDKHPDWQAMIADKRAFNVSGEKPVAYQGVNAMNLAISNANRGNTDNRFMTRNQAEKAGMSIKDDAKAMAVSYLQSQDREVNGKTVKIPFMRVAYVYNAKDIKGIDKAKANDSSPLGLAVEQLLQKSNIKVVRVAGAKAAYDDKAKHIVLPKSFKSESAFISTYAAIASKVAVEKNYTNDSKDIQGFKSQMAAALITQRVGAKFEPQGLGKSESFNANFLKNATVGMKAMRSSAKIANFVMEGKNFEITKDKSKVVDVKAKTTSKAKTVAKTKGSAAKALAKRKSKTNERAGLTR